MSEIKEACDRYEILQQIGSGSFGVVYLVKDLQREQQQQQQQQCDENLVQITYVMKQISLAKLDSRQMRDAQKEILLLSTLDHPNIVAYRHSFQTDAQNLHIIMDYCDGGDLYKKLAVRKRENRSFFPENQLMHWFVQVCLALKHIHDRKILHRDLKTQNIFACDDDHIVKVGDFGIARILDNTNDLAATCIGTPYYLSPEVCQNRPYGTKTDVWALGCCMYELATFKHPFDAKHLTELLSKIVRGTYEPLSGGFSARFKNLISHMLKVNVNDRPDVNALLQREYVYEHVTNFLKSTRRNGELAAVEELMQQKKKTQAQRVTFSNIRRQSLGFTMRRRPIGSSQKLYAERKFRMYLTPSVGSLSTISKAARQRTTATSRRHSVPPKKSECNDISSDSESDTAQQTRKTEAPIPADPVPTATYTIPFKTVPEKTVADMQNEDISETDAKKRKERRKWSVQKQPRLRVFTDDTKVLNGTAQSVHSQSMRAVDTDGGKASRMSSAISLEHQIPSVPGSVDEQDGAVRACKTCRTLFVVRKKKDAKKQKHGKTQPTHSSVCKSCRAVEKESKGVPKTLTASKSIYEKIECLRDELEKQLGVEKFKQIYTASTAQKNDHKNARVDMETQLREKFDNLLVLEKAYCS